MTSYGIGIDTGGTYTDAVLMDLATGAVLTTAKTPTTHHDLKVGLDQVIGTLAEAVPFPENGVKLVAVSSTLATNAVVEGQGADVALFVIGLDQHLELPVAGIKQITGGHTVTGGEVAPLDLENLVEGALFFRGKVDAYAVISAMSFANPTHEQVAEKAITMVDPKPVFLSHAMSARPGLTERAATTVLNARLMPVMQTFLDGVEDALKSRGLSRELLVVRGDGTAMKGAEAVQYAVHTVASGPAATAWFGKEAAQKGDALVVDVGGTTTDITLVEAGGPVVDGEGSRIGNLSTHVASVAMHTVGVGGDSCVRLQQKEVVVGPERVVPLAMAKAGVLPSDWMDAKENNTCLVGTMASAGNPIGDLLMASGPLGMGDTARKLGFSDVVLGDRISEWLRTGNILRIGFTPTDALHVLGTLDFGNREAAVCGAEILAAGAGMTVEGFCRAVVACTREKIRAAVVDFLVERKTGKPFSGFWGNGEEEGFLDIRFSLKVPMIGIGAAAGALLPEVAKGLGAELILPEHHDVGNAIGALHIGLAGEM